MHWEKHKNFNSLYRCYEIPKRSGGTRKIEVPHPTLKVFQRFIMESLYSHVNLHKDCHGFCRGRSIKSNALPHVGQEIVINIDIKNFFSSVTARLVAQMFEELGHKDTDFLTALTTRLNKLPQGAPSSPIIANLVCYDLDKKLSSLVGDKDGIYTRYADDITISGNVGIQHILPTVKQVLYVAGFRLNKSKTRFQRRGQRQEVTGLTVNEKVSIPRHIRKKIRAAIHYQANGKQPTWNGDMISAASLDGHINYLVSIHPELKNSHKYPFDGYNAEGFDPSGFDRDGFNRKGYDRGGFNREGYNRNGHWEDLYHDSSEDDPSPLSELEELAQAEWEEEGDSQREILREGESWTDFSESWERSQEEGWFYDDEY